MDLWLPDAPPRTVLRCMVPGCGRQFPETHRVQFERHVSACAKRNLDTIQEQVEKRRDIFTTERADPEMHKWLRQKADEYGPDEANKRLRGRKGR